MIGYKVMQLQGCDVVSGADNRLRYPLVRGCVIWMPGCGIFLSTNRQYVLDYYAGCADIEALLTVEFDARYVTSGNLTDVEPDFSVLRARIIDFEILSDTEEK